MKKVALVGACDRFNYGDLLFPIIIEKALSDRIKDLSFDIYGSIESKMSIYGGANTKALKDMKMEEYSTIIIVGGEVLTANWQPTYLHLQKSSLSKVLFKLCRKAGMSYILEEYSRKKLGCKNKAPWILENDQKNTNIIYNTVSGTSFDNVPKKKKRYITKSLMSSNYVSVRDSKTLNNLNNLGIKNIYEYPDSAFIMSKYFDELNLIKLISQNCREVIKDYSNKDFIVFQIGISYAKGNIDIIQEQLKLILNKTDLNIILLPVSNAKMHEDDVALNEIFSIFNTERVRFVKEPNIYDIMYIIGNARVFFGTSLHGNITALTYCVPSVALDNRIPKLTEFLKQYSVKNQIINGEYHKIYQYIKSCRDINKEDLRINRDRIIKKIEENFDNIATLIEREMNDESI